METAKMCTSSDALQVGGRAAGAQAAKKYREDIEFCICMSWGVGVVHLYWEEMAAIAAATEEAFGRG
eukprot:3026144-Amphidinium_carterae.1